MDFEEKSQVREGWQETSIEEAQQAVCEEPPETPSENSEEISKDTEQK